MSYKGQYFSEVLEVLPCSLPLCQQVVLCESSAQTELKTEESGVLLLYKVNWVKRVLMRLLIYLTHTLNSEGNKIWSVTIHQLHIAKGHKAAASLFTILLGFAQFNFALLSCPVLHLWMNNLKHKFYGLCLHAVASQSLKWQAENFIQ